MEKTNGAKMGAFEVHEKPPRNGPRVVLGWEGSQSANTRTSERDGGGDGGGCDRERPAAYCRIGASGGIAEKRGPVGVLCAFALLKVRVLLCAHVVGFQGAQRCGCGGGSGGGRRTRRRRRCAFSEFLCSRWSEISVARRQIAEHDQ
jgi:hypothetical protein